MIVLANINKTYTSKELWNPSTKYLEMERFSVIFSAIGLGWLHHRLHLQVLRTSDSACVFARAFNYRLSACAVHAYVHAALCARCAFGLVCMI